jgi:hypothetical protein
MVNVISRTESLELHCPEVEYWLVRDVGKWRSCSTQSLLKTPAKTITFSDAQNLRYSYF